MCELPCRIYDSSASIIVNGENAVCKNELGEISEGRLLTQRMVRCFGMAGQLSDNYEAIQWGNGSIWIRDHRQTF
jgi:hypothetical protein